MLALVDVDDDFLDRLEHFAILVLLHHDAGTRDRPVRNLRGASSRSARQACSSPRPRNVEGNLVFGFLDLERDISLASFMRRSRMTRLVTLSHLGAGERRVVHDEGHGDGGRSIGRACSGSVIPTDRKRVRNGALGGARRCDDVARPAPLRWAGAPDPGRRNLGQRPSSTSEPSLARTLIGWLAFRCRTRCGRLMMRPGTDWPQAAYRSSGTRRYGRRRRHMLDDEVEERRETVILRAFRVLGNPAVAARTVEDRKVSCSRWRRARRTGRTPSLTTSTWRASAVDLVDHHDRLQADLEGLARPRTWSAASGPSAASTSTMAESTIDRMRSTPHRRNRRGRGYRRCLMR